MFSRGPRPSGRLAPACHHGERQHPIVNTTNPVLPHPEFPGPRYASGPDPATSLAATVGNTPVVWIPQPHDQHRGYWAKLEGANPGGIKDRTALHMIAQARARGELAPDARIVESTSGTLGLGLALAAITFGHPLTLVTDPGLEPSLRHLLSAYGAHVVIAQQPHPKGGWQRSRRDLVEALLAEDPGAWCPNQYDNLDNTAAYAPLGRELAAQLGRVDVLVTSVGTGGHAAGTARALAEVSDTLRVVGVDSVGSTIFGQPARPRLMRGLGSSIHPRNVDYSVFDEVHWVAPAEAVACARSLAAAHYATGGWSVGAVALVAAWIARTWQPGTRIAAIFPDGPQRYAHSVFDDDYCRAHGLLGAPPPDDPDEVAHPREREVTRWTRCTTVVDPRAEGVAL
jgi:cysteine synthase